MATGVDIVTLPGASTNPDDLEIGSSVWSRTHQNASGFVGGCVIGLDPVARTVDVMVSCTPSRGPDVRTLNIDDLDHELTDYGTRNAGVVATNLFAWLGNAKGRDRSRRNAEWGALAVQLQSIRDCGTLTAGAESRYQADLDRRLKR